LTKLIFFLDPIVRTGPIKCPANYCKNGTCTVECKKYKCICEIGFVGEKCDEKDCSSNFCQNDGKCILTKESKKICQCKIGYFGSKCELSVCSIAPCQNGGE